MLVAGQLHAVVTSASCIGPHGGRPHAWIYIQMLPFELLPNFHTRGPAFFLLALGPINFGASGDGGKIKLSCVSLAELTSFTPPPHPWCQEDQGHTGSSTTRGHHRELEACLTWKPPWVQPLTGLAGLACEFPLSDSCPPTPAAPTQLWSSSSKPQLGTSQGGLSFIKLNFPRSGQRPGSRGAAGWKPGLEGR